jgi:predicted phosphoribosyltransferase
MQCQGQSAFPGFSAAQHNVNASLRDLPQSVGTNQTCCGSENAPTFPMFQDRIQAAHALTIPLKRFASEKDVLVVGLPRGGVPIARIVADALHAELDVCLVRKLGVPWQPELALGALAEGDVRVLDDALIRECDIDAAAIDRLVQAARVEIERRSALYRGSRPPAKVEGRLVIVVDDGLATGSTMFAAVRALRARGAGHIVVAIPVAPPSTVRALEREADDVVCLETHEPFYSVGTWYESFNQVDDKTVQEALVTSVPKK